RAGRNISIFGDFNRVNELSSGVLQTDVTDPGFGAIMHLHGIITPNLLGGDPLTNLTQLFGNSDADTFNFDQPYLGGRTRAYGSKVATPANAFAPVGDGTGLACDQGCEDTFNVNQLQTMPLGASPKNTLTLDGQSVSDTYNIFTTGSLGASHNYVINVLDTGAPDDGVDVMNTYGFDSTLNGNNGLTGNPYPTDDIFLLRSTPNIPFETANRPSLYLGTGNNTGLGATGDPYSAGPAFVGLLHTTLPVATNSDPI